MEALSWPLGKGDIWVSNLQLRMQLQLTNCGQTVSPSLPPSEYKRNMWMDLPQRFRFLPDYCGFCSDYEFTIIVDCALLVDWRTWTAWLAAQWSGCVARPLSAIEWITSPASRRLDLVTSLRTSETSSSSLTPVFCRPCPANSLHASYRRALNTACS